MARIGMRWLMVVVLVAGLAGCSADGSVADGGGGQDTGTAGDAGRDTGSDAITCTDQCDEGERVCTDDTTILRCEVVDGCTDWVEYLSCPANRTCEAGTCVDPSSGCTSVCRPADGPHCNRDGEVELCDDFDGDGCFEWGGATACAAGEFCDPTTGSCQAPSCADECTAGQTRCEEDLVQTCQTDAQGCLVFSAAEECPAGQACQSDSCQDVQTCTDECESGTALCTVDGGRRTCADTDGDGCTELSATETCPAGEECRDGDCVAVQTCQDECVVGQDGAETVCVGNKIAECGDFDADDCVEFGAPADCPSGQTCSTDSGTAACQGVPQSGAVVINEIFYDPVGQDARASGGQTTSPTFVELKGPSGLDVSGYVIELINGSNDQTYGSFTLPAGASLDGRGFAVVTMDTPDDYLQNEAPGYTNVFHLMGAYGNGTDALQNGHDYVVLSDSTGSQADAVGYGNFSGSTSPFLGESAPVDATTSGRSLGRVPGAADTDDNSADFISFYPTPGLANSDLLINEVYPDQPGVDDKTETFIELMAPVPGWEDLPLDGYVVHAINGYDGNDYIFGPNGGDGIPLGGYTLNGGAESTGYVVVCNLAADLSLLNICTAPYDGGDLQNGPDNVVLAYNGRTVDALGYGDFQSGDHFVGEGSSISYTRSDAGKSLGRWPVWDRSVDIDTDDNFMDFWWLTPTPGGSNPLP